MEFEDTGGVDTPVLIPVFRDVYAVVYSYAVGTGPGYVKTMDIEGVSAAFVFHPFFKEALGY